MATYVIGDIQGCARTLQALLAQLSLSGDDQLWCVGDLVNRGAGSLEVLRALKGLGARARVVLGNHDLHLLACSAGAAQGEGDTLSECLAAPDAPELLGWLRAQPLLYQEGERAMVHAGINPRWSWAEATAHARAAEEALRAPGGLETLARYHPSRKRLRLHSDVDLEPPPAWVGDLAWFTRVRVVSASGEVDERHKGGPTEVTRGAQPWFMLYEGRAPFDSARPRTLYFGHWAALGLRRGAQTCALDTGCIWGRYLTAMRAEDGAIFQQGLLEEALTASHQRAHAAERAEGGGA
ncbi:MAG: symmetrical bis(5'-nucleosyl)-tetraphosphatase [Deltaproteobacteria bacterium]|nr:symmetrical bis(5'-nucleosyl)-tetraphosphatase [Deltaproteobacteria bacterium]